MEYRVKTLSDLILTFTIKLGISLDIEGGTTYIYSTCIFVARIDLFKVKISKKKS